MAVGGRDRARGPLRVAHRARSATRRSFALVLVARRRLVPRAANRPRRSSARSSRCVASWPTPRTSCARRSTVVRSRAEVALQRARERRGVRGGAARHRARDRCASVASSKTCSCSRGPTPANGRSSVSASFSTTSRSTRRRRRASSPIAKRVRLEVDEFEEAPVDRRSGAPAPARDDPARQRDQVHARRRRSCGSACGARDDAARSRVTDAGVGHPAEQLPHVFERFYRGDAARTRDARRREPPRARGSDLSIAQWIAEEHGGTIRIESTPGQRNVRRRSNFRRTEHGRCVIVLTGSRASLPRSPSIRRGHALSHRPGRGLRRALCRCPLAAQTTR